VHVGDAAEGSDKRLKEDKMPTALRSVPGPVFKSVDLDG
jgi:hypothetical protein